VRPGDRITLLRRLADTLGQQEDWDDVDLVLRQFGFATSERWEGSQRSYVLNHLEAGTDTALVDLDEYLHGGDARAHLDPGDLPWEPGTFRLFVSHTMAKADVAGEIRRLLAVWHVDAFVAHSTIEPTREWMNVIEAALSSCDAMAALMTPDFVESKWCDQEVGYCVARNALIVPVKLPSDPHGFISRYQAASVRQPISPSSITDAVFRVLGAHPRTACRMAAPVIYRYARSRSFDGARANFELLQTVPTDGWTRELVEVAERAATENSQIREAVVLDLARPMPEAADELLAPIRERLGMNAPPNDDDIPF
jgi:hypothetical protein